MVAVIPINSTNNITLNDVFIINIRLVHLIHTILFIPWAFLYVATFRPVKRNEKIIMIGTGLLIAFATEGSSIF
jgi:hypothetical protein